MTLSERSMVTDLQKQGLGYRKIAKALNLNEYTVRGWVRRHPIKQEPDFIPPDGYCKNCGVPISIIPGHRPRRYCSDVCRMAWWKDNRDKLNRKAWYDLVCNYCGKEFKSYGDAKQKYCCRECYDRSRRSVHQ